MSYKATLFSRDNQRIAAFDIERPERVIWHGGRVWNIDLRMDDLRVLTYREIPMQPWQEPQELPMVTAIMPTTKERLRFLPTALRSWAEQTYPRKEIIIVSEDADEVMAHLPKHPNVVFRDCAVGASVGKKRNLAVEWARGAIIAHWDDDDWSYPERMAEQVAALRRYPAQACGYHTMRFISEGGVTREFHCQETVHGNSLAYWRDHWERLGGFRDIRRNEDINFLASTGAQMLTRLDGGEKRMVARHHGNNAGGRDGKYQYTPEWRVVEPVSVPDSPNILLGMLSWNRADVLIDSVNALVGERDLLKAFGYSVMNVTVIDNGSTDESLSLLYDARRESQFFVGPLSVNKGSAHGRNELLYGVGGVSDYVMLVDCDISVVPGSAMAMLHALQGKLTSAACVGADWRNGTEDQAAATTFCERIARLEHSPGLALTQYGMFQAGLLREYPFDENFGPGWGGEDNDWAMQVEAATGLQCYMTDEIRYLHRGAHGSLKHLKAGGLDVFEDAKARYGYLIRKWKGHDKFADIVRFFEDKVKRGDLLPVEVE